MKLNNHFHKNSEDTLRVEWNASCKFYWKCLSRHLFIPSLEEMQQSWDSFNLQGQKVVEVFVFLKEVFRHVRRNSQKSSKIPTNTHAHTHTHTFSDVWKACRVFLPLAPIILCWLHWVWFNGNPNNPGCRTHQQLSHVLTHTRVCARTHAHTDGIGRTALSDRDRKRTERLNSAESFLCVRLVLNGSSSLHTPY